MPMLLFILCIIFILLLFHPEISATCVITTSTIWLNKLVPILFPSFILIDFLSKNTHLEQIAISVFPLFKKIFKIRYYSSAIILILSFICGSPASTKFIKNALDNGDIDEKEAQSLLYSCSCLSLPYTLFILRLFHIFIPLYFLLFFLTVLCIMRLTSSKKKTPNKKKQKKEKTNYLSTFFSSIQTNTTILFSILGIMIFFNILLTLFHCNKTIYCYFEILNGQHLLLTLPHKYILFLIPSSLSFLGIAIHLQILSVCPNLNYKLFFLIRFIQSLFMGSCFFLIGFLI